MTNLTAHPVVGLADVFKTYTVVEVEVPEVKGITLRIPRKRFSMIGGPSGSGKTTLLNLIGCIDKPTSGRVFVAGQDTGMLSDDDLSRFRATKLGFVFQTFNLVPVLTAAENIEYPLRLNRIPSSEARARTSEMLESLNLTQEATQRPAELSG